MTTQKNTPERAELLKKRSRCQLNLDNLLMQGKNTAGVFPGSQLSGGMPALLSKIAQAKANLDAVQAALDQCDAEHPNRN